MYEFFVNLPEDVARDLMDRAKPRDVQPGEVVIQQGVSPGALMWVERGVLDVVREGTAFPLAHVGPGEVLGEISFVTGDVAVASVVAREPSRVYRIPFPELLAWLDRHPEKASRFYASLSQMLAHRLKQNLEYLPPVVFPPEFSEVIQEIKHELPILDREIRKKGWKEAEESVEKGKRLFFRLHDFLHKMAHALEMEDHGFHGSIARSIRREFYPWVLHTDLLRRALEKPRGYAGDYATILKIYRRESLAREPIGRVLDEGALEIPASRAVRNRKGLMREVILHTVNSALSFPVRVVSLACGPAEEIWDLLETHPDLPIEFHAVDLDAEALAYVQQRAAHVNIPVSTYQQNLLQVVFERENFGFPQADLVYSIGLIDYFRDRFVIRLLNRVYEHLKPGGKVILGNFHPRNPSRALMEWLVDWRLIHRTEEDMARLFENSRFQSRPIVTFEAEGINLFASAVR